MRPPRPRNSNCVICGSPTIKQRRTCSQACHTRALSNAGKIAADLNRPRGENHPLWKGGKEATRLRFKEDPVKRRARRMVSSSVRRGKLIRQPCEVCGEVKSEAHHEDYSRPLDVQWLCRTHHKEADRRLGVATGDFKSKKEKPK